MVRYFAVATALRLFSMSTGTRRAYRLLGNTFGQKKRVQSAIPSHYLDTAKRIYELCNETNLIKHGDHILEIGTGWVHWIATVLRLFFDINATLFDVWDNRQLRAYKHYIMQFRDCAEWLSDIGTTQRKRVFSLIDTILSVKSFNELYTELNFQYVVDPEGNLEQLGDDSFNLIVSANVLEHVERRILPSFFLESYRVLSPGGYCIHQIDLSDHLSHYDRSTSRKNYYRFSETLWTRWLENEVQYFNRIQRSEWLNYFTMAGFEVIAVKTEEIEIGNIKINKRYSELSRQDLECVLLTLILRKPKSMVAQ